MKTKAVKNPRTRPLVLRLSAEEREFFEDCAKHLGLTLSSWMRSVLLQGARKTMRNATKRG